MAGEWPLVLGFKTEFNDNDTWSENHLLHKVGVSRERSDKRPRELIADSLLPLHEETRNVKHDIFRIVRHDAIFVGSSPCLVVLMNKRFDVKTRPGGKRFRH